jgi:hypothetical protein
MKHINLKNLSPKATADAAVSKSHQTIDRSIRTLMQELKHENTMPPETPLGRLQRVLKIYGGIKPLLVILGSVPVIPSPWRAALKTFAQSLEALATTPEVTAAFKAGKDL